MEDIFHFTKLLSFDKSYTLGGKPAYKIVYETWFKSLLDANETYPQHMQVGTIINSIEYLLKFNADSLKEFNKYAPITEKIINSFEFV